MPQVKPAIETFAKIKVIGVGGSGGSALERMIVNNIKGVDFVALNTDVQALHHNSSPSKIHIGKTVTRGLGAGMNPDLGRKAAEEAQNEIKEMLKGADMVFITCGLGGGTGSGAGPVVAALAREQGALTVAVVTKPFSFEGQQRSEIAQQAWEELAKNVDAIITIPNDRLLQMIDKKTTLLDAFKIVDDVLRHGVRGIAELITIPGLINVDFADVRAIMYNAGSALMGIGTASGENRAVEAAKAAISSPLLELSIDGASGILFTITGGKDLTMDEVNEAAKIITSSAADNAKIIFGANIDHSLSDAVSVTVVATGFGDARPASLMAGIGTSMSDEDAAGRSFWGGANNRYTGYTASNYLRKVQKEEADEERKFKEVVATADKIDKADKSDNKPFSQTVRAKARSMATASASVSAAEEDELEIPAFIRKKMGM